MHAECVRRAHMCPKCVCLARVHSYGVRNWTANWLIKWIKKKSYSFSFRFLSMIRLSLNWLSFFCFLCLFLISCNWIGRTHLLCVHGITVGVAHHAAQHVFNGLPVNRQLLEWPWPRFFPSSLTHVRVIVLFACLWPLVWAQLLYL